MSTKRVIIVGGGLAGMSAAEALARNHGDKIEVSVLEAKRATGGRAGSFSDPASGETVDYCQHVAMGCCTNLIGLLDRCGLERSFERYTELQFLHPNHPPSRFAASRFLPAPFHLARTVSELRYLNRDQRRQIHRGLWRLIRCRPELLQDRTAGDWLRANNQDEETIRDFWDVILVSALGECTDVVTMSAVRKVFVEGFAVARGASDVLVPKAPLATLYGKQLREAIERLGVRVLTEQTVRKIDQLQHGAISVETHDGTQFETDHLIAAVPWHSVGGVLSGVNLRGLDQYSQIPSSPITGLHLWFDREISDRPHAVMIGTMAQWLFRRPFADQSSNSEFYYQVVISASRDVRSLTKEELTEKVLVELRQVFPDASEARVLRSRIVTDPKSVFSIRPEVEAARPASRTALPWLHLAGDWIATGWPATMEGAVISGRMAAQSVFQCEGYKAIEVDVPQRRGWLARCLIRS